MPFQIVRNDITIECNDAIVTRDTSGKEHYINSIKLLYNCDYSLVILDAESILTQYSESDSFSLCGLRYCDKRITEAPAIELTEEEKNQAFVIRDGVTYFVVGNGKSFISSVHYDEVWTPPNEKV